MLKARKKLRNPAGKIGKRLKPRRRKKTFISRVEARQRAERHVISQMFKGAKVRDGAKSGHRAYNVRREDTWVVYKKLPGTDLRSSDIIVVCKRTGRVLYEGSAHDEG